MRTRRPWAPRSTTTSSTRPVTTARLSPGSGSGASAGPQSSTCTEKAFGSVLEDDDDGVLDPEGLVERHGPGAGLAHREAHLVQGLLGQSEATGQGRSHQAGSADVRGQRGEAQLDGAHGPAIRLPLQRPRRPWRGSGTPW